MGVRYEQVSTTASLLRRHSGDGLSGRGRDDEGEDAPKGMEIAVEAAAVSCSVLAGVGAGLEGRLGCAAGSEIDGDGRDARASRAVHVDGGRDD